MFKRPSVEHQALQARCLYPSQSGQPHFADLVGGNASKNGSGLKPIARATFVTPAVLRCAIRCSS